MPARVFPWRHGLPCLPGRPFAFELPDNDTGLIARLTLTEPLAYSGVFYIDAVPAVTDSNIFPTTAVRGDSARFAGFRFDRGDNRRVITMRACREAGSGGLPGLAGAGRAIPPRAAPIPVPAAVPMPARATGRLSRVRRRARAACA